MQSIFGACTMYSVCMIIDQNVQNLSNLICYSQRELTKFNRWKLLGCFLQEKNMIFLFCFWFPGNEQLPIFSINIPFVLVIVQRMKNFFLSKTNKTCFGLPWYHSCLCCSKLFSSGLCSAFLSLRLLRNCPLLRMKQLWKRTEVEDDIQTLLRKSSKSSDRKKHQNLKSTWKS